MGLQVPQLHAGKAHIGTTAAEAVSEGLCCHYKKNNTGVFCVNSLFYQKVHDCSKNPVITLPFDSSLSLPILSGIFHNLMSFVAMITITRLLRVLP